MMSESDNASSASNQNGSIIVSILVITIFLSTTVFGLIVLANSNLVRARQRIYLLQAQYAAESGADSAIARLNDGDDSYSGSAGEVELLNANNYRASYSVTVAAGSDAKERVVTALGHVYAPKTAATPAFSRKIEVIVKRSATTTGSSLLSRNIIDLESGVKNVRAADIYVNGYIRLNKNTTNLIAENITVADKNTGAANCSIDGSGNLIKPASFSDPAQTRTKITTAFNNCPVPGNTSNADFQVLANQTTITKVQSTLIPWRHFMDDSYTAAPGGCGDFSGASPLRLPSIGNDKRSHYPDDGNNVSAACGSSGNIDLGSKRLDIHDHLHLRANLCAATACNPTFYNPDSGAAGIKFVFVEGTVNFDSVQTAPGSGPIVLISYGTDPVAKASVCPLGGSIYLGNAGNSSAPSLYLLANNGICLDKTRFSSDPALGGVSGKNIYISTNPGTPFDLGVDPTFPVDQIPIDLAWRAVRFRRL